MDKIIRKWALKNAVDHDGKAISGFVINKVIGEKSEAKNDMKNIAIEVNKIVKEINKMKIDDQKEELLKMWPEALDKKEEKPKELPELEDAVMGKVVMRFAPNVNGPMHIGHSRGAVINWLYCKKYNGRYILKLDDTDPETKPAQAWVYESHIKDTEWLTGEKPEVIYSSDGVKNHYKHAEKLIEMGKMYTCSCSAEDSHKFRETGKACPHRDKKPEAVMKEWKDMLAGKYKKGEMVLKLKTDLENPNPALRDWVTFRITEKPHPRCPEYKVWPMMDFANAIDDHFIGMTHIIKGKEHISGVQRQLYIYDYFGWKFAHTLYWGRIKIIQDSKEMKLSKSLFAKGIQEGKYTGWDDPRLPTLSGLRKRGIKPQAIVEFWKNIGLSERDIKASMEILEQINQKYT